MTLTKFTQKKAGDAMTLGLVRPAPRFFQN